jgi:glycerol-3-phosphate acyltransferase PlsY
MIILFLIISFLIGSIPTGLVIAKLKGVDLRKIGSGNIGATNVWRVIGKEAAIITLTGDILKGAVPIFIIRIFFPDTGLQISDFGFSVLQFSISNPKSALEGALGLSAILGHNFSIFLRFKGGKGVATSLGVLLVLSPHVALITATTWLFILNLKGYSSLSSLISFGLLPLSIYLLDYSQEKFAVAIAIALLIFIRHIPNIKRLIQGTESKVIKKK